METQRAHNGPYGSQETKDGGGDERGISAREVLSDGEGSLGESRKEGGSRR